MDKLIVEQYLDKIYLINEIELINEDISSFMKTFKPTQITKMRGVVRKAIVEKSYKKIISAFSHIKIPSISIDRIKSISKKASPKFNQNYTLAKKVLQNSLPVKNKNSDMIDIAALTLAAKVSARNLDMKKELKTFVSEYRKMSDGSENTSKLKTPPELYNEAVVGYVTVGLIFGTIGGAGVILISITGTIWAPIALFIVGVILTWWKKAENEFKKEV